MYFGWPQNSKLPTLASQQHFFTALVGMTLTYLISEFKFNDYVHYSSLYVQEQVIEIHRYDEWEEMMLTADKQMMKNIYTALQEVCLSIYNFVCEFYNISKLQPQIEQYYKLNGIFSMKMMFKATNSSTIVAPNTDMIEQH